MNQNGRPIKNLEMETLTNHYKEYNKIWEKKSRRNFDWHVRYLHIRNQLGNQMKTVLCILKCPCIFLLNQRDKLRTRMQDISKFLINVTSEDGENLGEVLDHPLQSSRIQISTIWMTISYLLTPTFSWSWKTCIR